NAIRGGTSEAGAVPRRAAPGAQDMVPPDADGTVVWPWPMRTLSKEPEDAADAPNSLPGSSSRQVLPPIMGRAGEDYIDLSNVRDQTSEQTLSRGKPASAGARIMTP